MNRLDGKIAVVTGGTQGLGAAVARRFAEAGAAGLVTCGRGVEKGMSVAAGISGEFEVPVHFVEADLALAADCRKVVAAARAEFGRVDALVNAAGLTDRGSVIDSSPELFDRMMAVNVRAPFLLIQDSVRLMIEMGIEGSIVNIGSTSALTGQPFLCPYSTSKGALATLTRNAGYALLRNRIRVNQLNIGWMATEGEDRVQREFHGAGDGWLEEAARNQPFGRLLDPAEVARAVAFLASDDSGMMTGSVVNFDQSVWGGCSFAPPVPDEPMRL